MIGVATHSKAGDLCIDAGAALLCVLELFENDRTAAVTEDEAVAVLVPRPAGLLRGLIASRQRFRLTEPAESAGSRGHLSATGDDHVGVAVLNRSHAEADRVGRCRARGDHAKVRAFETVFDRQVT